MHCTYTNWLPACPRRPLGVTSTEHPLSERGYNGTVTSLWQAAALCRVDLQCATCMQIRLWVDIFAKKKQKTKHSISRRFKSNWTVVSWYDTTGAVRKHVLLPGLEDVTRAWIHEVVGRWNTIFGWTIPFKKVALHRKWNAVIKIKIIPHRHTAALSQVAYEALMWVL